MAQTRPKRDIKPGMVHLQCDRPELDLTVRLGPASPKITNADNGWEIVGKPRQVGMTIWNGVEPLQMQFQIELDGFDIRHRDGRNTRSQEDRIRDLWNVARGNLDGKQPGILSIAGIPALPADEWIIESMEMDDEQAIRSRTNFNRVRQRINFVVREYSPPRYLPAKKPGGKGRGDTMTIKVHTGETPTIIARKIGCKWTDIRTLNPGVVKSANQKLRKGTKIRVPAGKKHGGK